MLRFTTQFQTSQSLQQIRLLRVARVQTSDWIQLRGSQAIQGSFVARCEKKFAVGRYNAQHVQILLQKVKLLS